MKRKPRKPILGPAFDIEFTNQTGAAHLYIDELRYYAPRKFGALITEGESLIGALESDDSNADKWQALAEWFDDCDSALTDWARDADRHEYIYFGALQGARGFQIDVESARDDCDACGDNLADMPRGFSGLFLCVNDHGNATLYRVTNSRARELFAVV